MRLLREGGALAALGTSRPEVERLRDWVGGTGAALVPKVELLAHEAPAREPITAFFNYVSAV